MGWVYDHGICARTPEVYGARSVVVAERIIATPVTAFDGSYQFSGLPLDDGDGDADYLVTVGDAYDKLRRYRKSTGPTPGADNNSQADPYAVALSAGLSVQHDRRVGILLRPR